MKTFLSTLVALFIGTTMLSAQTIWKADKAHSSVNFSVTHLVISEVNGKFKDFDVTVTQPSDDFASSTVEATIQTASISTDNDGRDKHLKSDDFFNAEQFPAITFKSTKITKTTDSTYNIEGNLTMRDSTKPVVLDAKVTGPINAFGGKRMGIKATTIIDRFNYGVKWNKTLDTGGLVAGKDIKVTLFLELGEKKPEANKKG